MSRAVTVNLAGVPVVAVDGAETLKWVAGFVTVTVEDVPVIEELTVSVAVIVRLPAVAKVTENMPVPDVNVEFAGSAAAASELVKCTVPEKPGITLSLASSAVTVKLKAVPIVAVGGMATAK